MLLKPAEILEVSLSNAVEKTRQNFLKTLMLGFAAGAFIAFGALLATQMLALTTDVGIGKLLAAAMFSLGLVLVICAGGELFTGNMLLLPAYFARRITLKALLANWVLVFFSNFLGALFVVMLMRFSGLPEGETWQKAQDIAIYKATLPALQVFMRGILCNWLVCLGVWMALAADTYSGKFLAAFFPVTAFVLAGFEHVVANMYFLPLGLTTGANISLGNCFSNLFFAALGNIVGGGILVGWLYYFAFTSRD